MKLPKVTKARLTDQIVEILYNKIALGELKPGDKLPSESELSKQLGVGRPTVREALSRLIGLGLIQRIDYHVAVSESAYASIRSGLLPLLLEDWEIRELYEARILIECDLITLAIRKATPENIRELRDINRKMRDNLSKGQDYWKNDIEFHSYITNLAGNEVMKIISDITNSMFQRYEDKIRKLHEIHSETYHTHRQLIDAIEKKDIKTAKDIIVQAFSNSEKALYKLKRKEV